METSIILPAKSWSDVIFCLQSYGTNGVAPPTAPRTESWVDMSLALLSMLESISIDSTTAPIAEPYDLGPLAFSPLEGLADLDAASTSPWSSLFSRSANIFDVLVFWTLESRADVASTSRWPSLFRRSAGPYEELVVWPVEDRAAADVTSTSPKSSVVSRGVNLLDKGGTLYYCDGIKWPLWKIPQFGHGFQDQLSPYTDQKEGSILQYFRPLLSYLLSLRSLFCLFWVAVLHRLYCTQISGNISTMPCTSTSNSKETNLQFSISLSQSEYTAQEKFRCGSWWIY